MTETANIDTANEPVTNDPTDQIVAAELALIEAAEAFLAAAAEFAAIPETPAFYVGEGFRLQFAGHQLYTLTTA